MSPTLSRRHLLHSPSRAVLASSRATARAAEAWHAPTGRRAPSHGHAALPPRELVSLSPRWLLPLWRLRSTTEDPQPRHRWHRHCHAPRRRRRRRQELTRPPNRSCAEPCRHRSSSPLGRSATTCLPTPHAAPSLRGYALRLAAQRCGASVRGLAARASPRRTGCCTRRSPSYSVRWRRSTARRRARSRG